MKHISILVPVKAILGSVEGPRQLFTQVNAILESQGATPLFKVQLVGLQPETPIAGGHFTVHADAVLTEVKQTDLIIIPALDGDLPETLALNQAFVPWLVQQHARGAEVASLCMGAFLLAQTGLLNGKKCATHWMAANAFRQMYPQVNLVDDCILTDEQGLYSSGGAFSYLNLLLHLIEKYAGRQMAVLCAKVFAIEINRGSQSPFVIFEGQKEHQDEPVRKAQEYIEGHYTTTITIDALADRLALGRRTLERRFKKATHNTVAEYVQRVKVEAAKKGFETSRKNISEIMYEVGYTDLKAFRTTFRKITGLTPVEYKNRYNKAAI